MASFDFGIATGIWEGRVLTPCAFHSSNTTGNAMRAGGNEASNYIRKLQAEPDPAPAFLQSKQQPLPHGVQMVGHPFLRHFVGTGES